MKPFYASAVIFLTACSLYIAADGTRYRSAAHYDIGFGSIGSLHR